MGLWGPVGITLLHAPQAAPAPVLGALNKLGTQSVCFNVARDGEEMGIVLHHERLEAALVNMPRAGRGAVSVKPLRMGERHETHVARKIAVPERP
jgi:hypothetical protein